MESLLRALSELLAVPITPTISVSLAVWVAFGMVAARFNAAGWWRRRRILKRARAEKRPERELELAYQRYEAELVACLIQLAFLSVGVLVATAAAPPPPLEPPAWQFLAIGPVFMLVQILLAFESWRQNRYDHRRVHMPPVSRAQQLAEGETHHDAAL